MTRLRPLWLLLLALSCATAAAAQAPVEPSAALRSALCQGRRPCRVEEVLDAGTDEAGRALRVGRVLLSPESHPHADGSPSYGTEECARFEWLLAVQRGRRWSARPLVEICNDGYGARGIGEDTVVVGPNRFTHTRVGGSAWGWSESVTLSLSPLAIVSTESGGYWSIGSNLETSSVVPASLWAAGSWWAPLCVPDGDPPLDADREIRWVAIPRARLGTSELAALRSGAGLGSCGVRIDGLAPQGVTLEGTADPASAALRALWVEGGPLVVEVEDERLTEHDALELWVGGARPSYMEHCREPSSVEPPRRIRIAVADGSVEASSGLEAPRVERVATAGTVRFFVDLPSDTVTLTVAYQDDDAGTSRRIASSTLDVRDATSLGDVASFRDASCVLEHGALVPAIDTRVTGEAPIVPAY